MPTYRYRAKKGTGDTIEGKIVSQTEKEAVEKLSQSGYLPLYIEESCDSASDLPHAAKRKVKPGQITIFGRQLASLLKSGVPILKALDIISEQSEDMRLKDLLRHIHDGVKSGSAFSSALAQYPGVFPPIYIAMVHAGENSGALPGALLRISDYRIKEEEIMSRIRMVSVYPILMLLVGTSTIVFMFTFVMPRLIQMFVNMGRDLPLPTRILIAVTNGFHRWWPLMTLILISGALSLRWHLKGKGGKLSLSMLKLHIPLFGKFILKAELARFSRTLELLLRNGISILKAIDIAIPVLDNEVIKHQLRQSFRELEHGSSLGRSLKDSAVIPLFMSNLVIVGEESGNIEEALAEVASSYERDVDEAIRIAGNLLEPIMILIMGLVVGFIVIAMLLPIFEINV